MNCGQTKSWSSPSPTRNGVPTTGCDEDKRSVGQHHHWGHGKRVERFVLYWPAEEEKANAIMEFPYRPGVWRFLGVHSPNLDDGVRMLATNCFRN